MTGHIHPKHPASRRQLPGILVQKITRPACLSHGKGEQHRDRVYIEGQEREVGAVAYIKRRVTKSLLVRGSVDGMEYGWLPVGVEPWSNTTLLTKIEAIKMLPAVRQHLEQYA
jgi:hypothetical protein